MLGFRQTNVYEMETTSVITKLTDERNWSTWKFQIKVSLKAKGYFEFIDGTKQKPKEGSLDYEKNLKKWLEADCKAQEIIVSRLSEGPITHVYSCETAAEIWSKLNTVYERKSEISLHLLQQKFFNLAFSKGENVCDFLSRLEEIVAQMGQCGEKISEKMVITKILMSLPKSFGHLVSAWESVPEASQSKEKLTARLLIEEERIKNGQLSKCSQSPESALAASSNRRQISCYNCGGPGHTRVDCKQVQKQSTAPQVRCHFCNKLGHFKKNCYKFKQLLNSKQDSRENIKNKGSYVKNKGEASYITTAFISNNGMTGNNIYWFLDTGATEHLCCKRDVFVNLRNLNSEKWIRFGGGDLLQAAGIGDILVKSEVVGGSSSIVTIQDVLYVPGMTVNLFSVSTALDKGYRLTSDKDEAKIWNKSNQVCATASRDGNLFKMNFKPISDSDHVAETAFLSGSSNQLDVWHHKLAHQNIAHVKKVLSNNNINVSGSELFCDSCVLGKHKRNTFKQSYSRASNVGELFHADLCGPMETTSIGGAKYFLLFKDDCSSYRFVYFLKCKSEVIDKLISFLNLVKNQTGENVKVLRTDGGGEFVNSEIAKLLSELGIVHQISSAYCPEQNGRAEREMRTVVESARTMLVAKNLGKEFWAEAVNTAVFVLNRTGTSPTEGKTPYELWYGKSFDIKWLQVFGSKVYVHVPKCKRRKWDNKSKPGIFVGYSDTTKGYRIYIPCDRKVEISCNVIFDCNESIDSKGQHKNLNSEYIDIDSCSEDTHTQQEVVAEVNRDDSRLFETIDPEESQHVEEVNNVEDQQEVVNQDGNVEEIRMLRNRENIRRPQRFGDYETGYLVFSAADDPKTYDEAMKKEDSEKWKQAISEELKNLQDNNTWTVVDRPPDVSAVDTKWVFKTKKAADGKTNIYKARLVARGFQQLEDFDFSQIYAPVAKLTTLRVLTAIANQYSFHIHQMDVTGAFLYGDIEEVVYLSIPLGFNGNENQVLKLNKAIYGLKRSPKNWNDKFNKVMEREGFYRSHNDTCLYYRFSNNVKLYVLIYVDDLIIVGNDLEEVKSFKTQLSLYFKMKDVGPVSTYLGIKIEHDLTSGITTLNQTDYLKQVLERFGMSNCKSVSTPMDANFRMDLKNLSTEDKALERKCRSVIGCLMYAMLGSRPDLCYPISFLSRYQDKASEELWSALKRVLRYVKGTLETKLVYRKGNIDLKGFVDADWAGDNETRHSTSGYLFRLGSATVSWSSKRQTSVALSSTEAEYVALSSSIVEACFLKKILQDLKISELVERQITIYEDNQSAVHIANSEENKRLKHIDVRYHYIKEKVKDGTIVLKHISSQEQLADLLTKPLGKLAFQRLREGIGLK